MEKIASFTINHLLLEPGIYLSRKDKDPETGCIISTFDLRLTAPNREPVMNTAGVHAIEHLGATYLRNDPEWAQRTVYFGPMGCRTGFYLVVFGDYRSKDMVDVVTRLFEFIRDSLSARQFIHLNELTSGGQVSILYNSPERLLIIVKLRRILF